LILRLISLVPGHLQSRALAVTSVFKSAVAASNFAFSSSRSAVALAVASLAAAGAPTARRRDRSFVRFLVPGSLPSALFVFKSTTSDASTGDAFLEFASALLSLCTFRLFLNFFLFLFFITSPAGRRSPAPNLEARVCNANALLLCVKNFQSGGLLLREGGGLLLREGGLGALLLCVQNFQSGGLLLRQGSGLLLREGGLGGLGGLGGGSGGGGGGGLACMADQSSALGPHPQCKCNRATVCNAKSINNLPCASSKPC